jgi:2-dehydro-3-deoxygluconokinase
VIIKLGADGCFALVDGRATRQPAIAVHPVDTVGAGDAFVAGYVSEYVAGHGISTRLTTAVTAGAFACLTHGDWEGMPRQSELGLLNASEPVTR